MLVLVCVSILIGVVSYHVLGVSLGMTAAVAVLITLATMLVFHSRKAVLFGVVLGSCVMLGALRFWMIDMPTVSYGNRTFMGTVTRVDPRLDTTLIVVTPENEDVAIQVTIPNGQPLLPGDRVFVRGVVERAEDFVTDTGRVFHYREYLAGHGVDAVIQQGEVQLIERAQTLSLERLATSARLGIAKVLHRYIAFPIDGVIAGMLVGYQGGIPDYISDIFRTTGTLHTLVLSGYNITVVAGFAGVLLRRFTLKKKSIGILLSIAALVIVSGSGVAALRAGVMGAIALFASATLEEYQAFRALLYSFLFFFITNPYAIVSDPGFHLSFLATFFIVTILPIAKRSFDGVLWRIPTLRETLLLAIGLPIFMLPYFMYFSGIFPVVTPLANIVIAPVIPILMIGGASVLVFGWIPAVASVSGAVLSWGGGVLVAVLTVLSHTPQVPLPFISGMVVCAVYVVLLCVLFHRTIWRVLLRIRRDLAEQTS